MTRRVHRMPFGTEILPDGVRFSLYSPTAGEVSLILDGREHPLPKGENGWRGATMPTARPGMRYAFRIDRDATVPDPASRFQPDDVFGQSLIVDPRAHLWTDGDWTGRPWEEAVIYEAHVGTATPEGTFAALTERLEYLRDLGITALELLPIADFAGSRNWGYDGVLPFAPDAAYGTPYDLKRLVERAHGLGIMVLLDVVYNHFGPTGNYLHAYARSFFTERHQTPWGAGLNFDGEAGPAVRDFFVHNALYWLEEYHLDGLRFDAVHAILDDSRTHIIAEIAERLRGALPDRPIHLILENEANEARWLERDADGATSIHTAQWNDDSHHCWHVLLTGEQDAYYRDFADKPVERLARCLSEGFAYQGEIPVLNAEKPRGEPSAHLPPTAFVNFLQNHDQIGNRAFGDRLASLAAPERLALARAILLLAPQIPMLFMGEEWSASTPFQFFVDFPDEGLSTAVREGRRREFSGFAAFADPDAVATIPDPTVDGPFLASKLRWDERREPGHADVLADTSALLHLRREAVVPLIGTRYRGAEHSLPADRCIRVEWRFDGGDLMLAANFGDSADPIAVPVGGDTLWRSPGVSLTSGSASLPSWTGIVTRSASDGRA